MADHPLAADVNQPDLGEEIELFAIDCRAIMSDSTAVSYFCSNVKHGTSVQWKGVKYDPVIPGYGVADPTNIVTYIPISITATGFEATSQGSLPSPKLTISNIGTSLAGPMFTLMRDYDDLLGAKLVRWKTFGKYLYGATGVNYGAHFPPDVYVLNRKLAHNPRYVEWELSPEIDATGVMLPKRLILRDSCQLRYRTYVGTPSLWTFSYNLTENACPIINRVILKANSSFITDDGWTLTDGWAVTGGSPGSCTHHATHTGPLSAPTSTYANTSSNIYYTCFVVTSNTSAGSIGVKLGSSGSETTISNIGAGPFVNVFPIYNSTADQNLIITPTGNFVGTIDDVVLELFATSADASGHSTYTDVCSHTLDGCKLRWKYQALPFSGFPGVARVRV